MPGADLPIHDNQTPAVITADGLSIRSDVLFTNDKGEEKESVQKRSKKILQKLQQPLQRILQPGEPVLYAMRARSRLSPLEQLTAAWWTSMLAACAIIVTNKRILFFPVKRDGSWRESVQTVYWGDIQQLKQAGILVHGVFFKFKNGTEATYTNVPRGAAKKLSCIASVMIPNTAGEQTATSGLVHLCPDCCGPLTDGHYFCPSCGLIFKNEKTMILRSILLPGGGYFYTGHPLAAIIPAVVEVLLVIDIVSMMLFGLRSPQASQDLFTDPLVLVVFWGLESAITILHCRRYVREFIPDKREPSRMPHPAR